MDPELDPQLRDRRRKFRKAGVVVALLLLVLGIGCWQLPAILDHWRGWRSRRLAASAEDCLSKHEIHAAFDKAKSAYYLKGDEPTAIWAVAHVLDAAGKPQEALAYWKLAAKPPHGTFADRQSLAEDLLRVGAIADAEKAVGVLRAEQPKSGAVLRLAGRLAAAQGRLPEGLAMVKESLEVDPRNPEGRLLAAALLAQSSDEAERNVGLESFWELALDTGPIGLRALEVLAQWRDLPSDKAKELIGRLRDRTAPDERLRLFALDVALRAHPEQKEEILNSAVAEYALKSPEARHQVALWLNANGEHQRTLGILPEAESFTRKDLLLVRLDALAALGRWQEVRRILDGRDVPLEGIYRQVFLARCVAQEGDLTRAESHWRRARTHAGSDNAQMWFVGDYAERSAAFGEAEQAYRAIIRNTADARAAFDALLRVVSQDGDTLAIRDVLAEMRKQYPLDSAIENDLAYFNLLLGENVESAKKSAETLRFAAPGNLAHRTTLALAFCRLDQPAAALAAYDGLEIPWSRVPASQRAVHAAVLGLTGNTEGAQHEVAALPLERLRPEEKKLVEAWSLP